MTVSIRCDGCDDAFFCIIDYFLARDNLGMLELFIRISD